MALGASPWQVQTMVLGQGMKFVLYGVTLGLGAAFAFTRLMEKLLFEVKANDPLIYAGLAGFISIVAVCACWLPARRATKVDPMIALRSE
jgi:ABC-type antimicrobial peptide transport system permease subunit